MFTGTLGRSGPRSPCRLKFSHATPSLSSDYIIAALGLWTESCHWQPCAGSLETEIPSHSFHPSNSLHSCYSALKTQLFFVHMDKARCPRKGFPSPVLLETWDQAILENAGQIGPAWKSTCSKSCQVGSDALCRTCFGIPYEDEVPYACRTYMLEFQSFDALAGCEMWAIHDSRFMTQHWKVVLLGTAQTGLGAFHIFSTGRSMKLDPGGLEIRQRFGFECQNRQNFHLSNLMNFSLQVVKCEACEDEAFTCSVSLFTVET